MIKHSFIDIDELRPSAILGCIPSASNVAFLVDFVGHIIAHKIAAPTLAASGYACKYVVVSRCVVAGISALGRRNVGNSDEAAIKSGEIGFSYGPASYGGPRGGTRLCGGSVGG